MLNTVDVIINSTTISTDQPIIQISGTPKSYDVIGLQDLYLQLDISNSTFETIVDEVSSGLDPSASNYIVSSSYASGSLVRAGGRNNEAVTTSVSSTTGAVQGTSSTNTTTSTSTTSSSSGGGSYSSGY